MKESVRRKAKEFNKYYEEVMSKDSTEEFLEKNLEVVAKVAWAVGEKRIDLGLKVIFADGDTGDFGIKFDKQVLEAGAMSKNLNDFIIDYKLAVISVINTLKIDIDYYPEYVCKMGMDMDGGLHLDIIYLHNLEADYLKEILNKNARAI